MIHDNIVPKPGLFLGFLLLGVSLIISWQQPITGGWWDAVDRAIFFYANASIGEHSPWTYVWAVSNHRAFDLVPASLILGLYAHFVLKSNDRTQAIAYGLFMAIYSVICIQATHLLWDLDRESPSLVLEPAYRLTNYVDWSAVKDASGRSFPGDHAAVLLLVSLLMLRQAPYRYVWLGLVIALVFSVPRLVGGAHWFTDIAIGSLSMACIASAIAVGTGLAQYLSAHIARFLARICQKSGIAAKFLNN